MKIANYRPSPVLLLFFALMIFSLNASASLGSGDILDNVLTRYSTAASSWAVIVTGHATRLFWTLALISMVWTFGMMALRKADLAEFFTEFVRFTIFTGFFWWLLINGPNFATSIMASLRTIGGNATGTGPDISPSRIVDVGFDIFSQVISKSTVWSPFTSAVGVIVSIIILIVLALVSVNMLLLLISGWVLAYAGIFFLGFGGSRWTSEIAISYFKTVLSIAAQLFAMVLLVGIGRSIISQFYANISGDLNLNELVVMMIVSIILLALVTKVPGLIGSLAMGGGTGALGNGFGAGAIVSAAAIGAAAASTAGAAVLTGVTNVAGGAHALMAAFSTANAAANASNGERNFLPPANKQKTASDNMGGAGADSLAAAMGDDPGQTIPTEKTGGSADAQGTDNSAIASQGEVASSSNVSPEQNGESASKSLDTAKNIVQENTDNSSGTQPDPTFDSPSSLENNNPGNSTNDESTSSSRINFEMASSNSGSGASMDYQNSQSSTSNYQGSGKNQGTTRSVASKVGKVAIGTAVNLLRGGFDVGVNAAAAAFDSLKERTADTLGGKIAAAIKVRDNETKAHVDTSVSDKFGENSLPVEKKEPTDPAAEIAAFRDSKPT